MSNMEQVVRLIETLNSMLTENGDRISIRIYVNSGEKTKQLNPKMGMMPKHQTLFNFPLVSLDDYESFILSKMYRQRGRPTNPVYLSLVDKLRKNNGKVKVHVKHLDLVSKKFNAYQYAVDGDCIYLDTRN